MENERIVAAIAPRAAGASVNTAQKDLAIFQYEWQPVLVQERAFKRSETQPNSVAVTESHIFAAQHGKAVVHVYSREKNNQEAIIPFPEKITALAAAADNGILILGTEKGRILLWEVR